MAVKGYQTQQKRELLAFLRRHALTPLSIEDMVAGLHTMGKSTVYRLVNQLVESGDVARFVKGNNRHFVYQYLERDDCRRHLHCRCVTCGKLYHLDDAAARGVQKTLGATGFFLDPGKTVLMGTCAGCGGKEQP